MTDQQGERCPFKLKYGYLTAYRCDLEAGHKGDHFTVYYEEQYVPDHGVVSRMTPIRIPNG